MALDDPRPTLLGYATPSSTHRFGVEHVVAAVSGITFAVFGCDGLLLAIYFVFEFSRRDHRTAEQAIWILLSFVFSATLLTLSFVSVRFAMSGKKLKQ